MKIPFPYWLAAEFFLFQPPPKKMTLIHLLIGIVPSSTAIMAFVQLTRHHVNGPTGFFFSVLLFIAMMVFCYRCACFFLPFLMKAVERGLVQKPDVERLENQIRSNAGWK